MKAKRFDRVAVAGKRKTMLRNLSVWVPKFRRWGGAVYTKKRLRKAGGASQRQQPFGRKAKLTLVLLCSCKTFTTKGVAKRN